MEPFKPHTLFLLAIFILTISRTTNSMDSSDHAPNKGAYWPSWSDLPPSAIDTTLFTHAYFAFLSPSNITFKFEIDYPTALLLKNFTTTLHRKNPPLKTMFSIGGASDGSVIFSPMASTRESRKSFILSTIEVARKFEFDGIDLDWEFPQTPGDMANLKRLLHEWRAAVKKEAKAVGKCQLLLSAATYYSPEVRLDDVYRKYPVGSINKNLDWINAMCYDYHGGWDPTATGALASLYDPNSNVSTSHGLQLWIGAKIRREKLVMGLPLYGRTWQLKDPLLYGIGARLWILDQGLMAKCRTSWIGYDDVRSVTSKVAYARAHKLGGYFFWAVSGDQDWKISRRASETWTL
ncbi:hypothetical protein OSB04_020926 [Centaurea solstitialis]|uniref:GH18 domain-containing protein n=1 Tax=Centaurea solstitialis TaxID=347529 RepID=A0AA38STL0_9ASTR|nr:hypothetical protein OSB04_020926 [Centaurea solstitialis]